jgi:hypothetical protein
VADPAQRAGSAIDLIATFDEALETLTFRRAPELPPRRT